MGLMKKVDIEWLDSWGVSPNWESYDEARSHDLCFINTSGYLLKKDKHAVWVTMSNDDTTKMVCGVMVIPRKCIVNYEEHI